eukprot:11846865-Heterocapsa_arctica.AAC.1
MHHGAAILHDTLPLLGVSTSLAGHAKPHLLFEIGSAHPPLSAARAVLTPPSPWPAIVHASSQLLAVPSAALRAPATQH